MEGVEVAGKVEWSLGARRSTSIRIKPQPFLASSLALLPTGDGNCGEATALAQALDLAHGL